MIIIMNNKFDVIVVGCGPAGAQAAKNISKNGKSVLVLDHREEIGNKLCTGIVGSELINHYPKAKNFIYYEANSAKIFNDSNHIIDVKKDETQALVIDRIKFIQSIIQEAVDYGSILKKERLVTSVKIDEEGVHIKSRFNGKVENYFSKLLIVASGFNSKIAKSLGFDLSNNYIYGYQTKISNLNLKEVNVFTGGSLPKGHFGWLVPTNKNKGLCGILGKSKLKNNGKDFLEEMQSNYNFNVEEKTKVWGIPIQPVKKNYSERCLLIGDVAGQVKPTTGGGIYYAMKSSDIASEIVTDALNSNNFSEKKLSIYSKKWNQIFKNELRIGLFARQFYESLNNNDIVKILNHVKDSELISSDINFDWHSRIIMMAFKTKIRSYIKGSLITKFKKLRLN